MANVSAKSSGDPVSHKALWNALMEGTVGLEGGDAGGEGGPSTDVSCNGEGKGCEYRFLAIPALLMSRSIYP